jgi:hypothetical protein
VAAKVLAAHAGQQLWRQAEQVCLLQLGLGASTAQKRAHPVEAEGGKPAGSAQLAQACTSGGGRAVLCGLQLWCCSRGLDIVFSTVLRCQQGLAGFLRRHIR